MNIFFCKSFTKTIHKANTYYIDKVYGKNPTENFRQAAANKKHIQPKLKNKRLVKKKTAGNNKNTASVKYRMLCFFIFLICY